MTRLTRLPFVDRCRSVLSAVVRASSRVRSVGGTRSRSFGQGLIFETRARQVVEREVGGETERIRVGTSKRVLVVSWSIYIIVLAVSSGCVNA